MKTTNTKGNLILLFTAFIWGMAFAFQSEAGDIMGPFTFGAARMSCAAIALIILAFVQDKKNGRSKKNFDPIRKKNSIKAGLICGSFMGIATTFQQAGLMYTSAGKAGFITALYILIVPVVGAIIFKNKVDVKTWICVVIAVVGMYFLCVTPGEGFSMNLGDLYCTVCAFAFSLQIVFADRFVDGADPVKMSAVQFSLISLGSWILALIFEDPFNAPYMDAIVSIAYCGFISGGVGYTLQLVGQKYTDPTSASLCMSFESVFAVVGGVIILHEIMSGRELLGCIIMFAAIIIVQLPQRKRE